MSEPELRLAKAPIVEAVIDIDCDMPPTFDLAALEPSVKEGYGPQYPKFRATFLEHHRIEAKRAEPSVFSTNRALQSLQLLHDDEKQLVQVRAQGYSFNRLAPYTTLDDYLPEIERTWRLYLGIATPVQVRVVRLRYINRILLPITEQGVELEAYVKGSPLPADDKLKLTGFLNQYAAVEVGTGHEVNVVVTAQPTENDHAPIILDICAASGAKADPNDWTWISRKIGSLRGLKNRVFRNTLTPRCLSLFQH